MHDGRQIDADNNSTTALPIQHPQDTEVCSGTKTKQKKKKVTIEGRIRKTLRSDVDPQFLDRFSGFSEDQFKIKQIAQEREIEMYARSRQVVDKEGILSYFARDADRDLLKTCIDHEVDLEIKLVLVVKKLQVLTILNSGHNEVDVAYRSDQPFQVGSDQKVFS